MLDDDLMLHARRLLIGDIRTEDMDRRFLGQRERNPQNLNVHGFYASRSSAIEFWPRSAG